MSNPNLTTGSGNRRLRAARLVAALSFLVAVPVLGFFLLREERPKAPEPEAQKDVAAMFESVQGNVKTRGVGGLDWKTAEVKVPLRRSDLVRTYPSSSAEIRFFDETRVTVRPDSLITIEETSRDPNSTSSRVAWKVTSGEINYETARKEGSTEAVTPTFRLALEGNSAGTMRVGEGGQTAVAQLSGAASIETKSGEKIRLVANEGLRVDASGKAGAKEILPDPPSGNAPGGDAHLISLAEGAPVSLSWTASAGAAAYRVQVESKNSGSQEVVFDRDGLPGTTASIPGLTEGDFSFRVAGLTQDGVQGRFSIAVSFKVERTPPPPPRVAPPSLVIEAFEARNNVLRLVGKTEPGARLTVNGDPVTVQSDGSFSEFVTLARREGEQRVVIRSTSLTGGVAEETRTLAPVR
ncbi:MAG: FecR domain-containing protein [Vicinamibacteria bacterium]|nr:FecR domain-containing protein [Vicinamibacteria bacterium]